MKYFLKLVLDFEDNEWTHSTKHVLRVFLKIPNFENMSWNEIDQIHTLCWWGPGWDLCWFSKLDIEVSMASASTELSRGSFFTVAILSLCFRTLCRKDDLIAADVNRFLITKLFRTWAKDSAEVSYPWSPWLCCRGCKANLIFIIQLGECLEGLIWTGPHHIAGPVWTWMT